MAGQMVHLEIPAGDTAKAREFWGGLFGWEFQADEGSPVRVPDDPLLGHSRAARSWRADGSTQGPARLLRRRRHQRGRRPRERARRRGERRDARPQHGLVRDVQGHAGERLRPLAERPVGVVPGPSATARLRRGASRRGAPRRARPRRRASGRAGRRPRHRDPWPTRRGRSAPPPWTTGSITTRRPSTEVATSTPPWRAAARSECGERALDRLGIDPDDRPGAGGTVGGERRASRPRARPGRSGHPRSARRARAGRGAGRARRPTCRSGRGSGARFSSSISSSRSIVFAKPWTVASGVRRSWQASETRREKSSATTVLA